MILHVKRLIFMKMQKYKMHWYRDSDEIFDFPTHPLKVKNFELQGHIYISLVFSNEIVWSTTPPYGQNENFLEPSVWFILQKMYGWTSPGRDGGQTE